MIDVCSLEKKPLLSVEEAKQRIFSALDAVTETEEILLTFALNRILAVDIYAPISLPTERNSAMDGYAFNSADLVLENETILQNVGVSWAGKPFEGVLNSGECVRIFTGAVLPENADSVVMQEKVIVTENQITLSKETKPLQNVRYIGEDVKQNDLVFRAGKKITAYDLGLFAALGIEKVLVKRQLKIVFFSTGDELVELGQPLASGQIYNSNLYLLTGLLENKNYCVTNGGVIADNFQALENQLVNASKNYDVILTTGGASVGDADYVHQVLEKNGNVNFWKLAIKPGKPLTFGKINQCYFFGLPGNPIAVAVTFDVFIDSALKKLSGAIIENTLKINAICTTNLKKSRGRQEYQRGFLTQDAKGNFFVSSTGKQGSNILTTLSKANCYIVLNPDCEGVTAGENVIVEPFC